MKSRLIDEYPRGTIDFVPFTDLTVNGVPVTTATDVEVAVVGEYDQPGLADWTPADTLNSRVGFLLTGPSLGRGVFRVFVRKPDAPTTPVIVAGYFRLT